MTNVLKMYYPQHSVTLPYLEAVSLLKTAPFGVFLSFVDPRIDTLIQKSFPFFYEPLNTYGLKGRCFISEWNGLNIYIPADLNWYIKNQQESKRNTIIFRQGLTFLSSGRFVTKDTDVEVGVNFRISTTFDVDFLPLLSRSGHGHLATYIAGTA